MILSLADNFGNELFECHNFCIFGSYIILDNFRLFLALMLDWKRWYCSCLCRVENSKFNVLPHEEWKTLNLAYLPTKLWRLGKPNLGQPRLSTNTLHFLFDLAIDNTSMNNPFCCQSFKEEHLCPTCKNSENLDIVMSKLQIH